MTDAGSIPVVVVSEFGETISGTPVEKWNSRIGGFHKKCGASTYVIENSSTHDAIVCKRCLLRIPIPIKVSTYKDLLNHFRQFNPDPNPPENLHIPEDPNE